MSELIYKPEDHTYWHNGIQIPGATELLNYFSYIDDTWYTPEGCERGTVVHEITALIDQKVDPRGSFPDDWQARIDAYQRFKQDKKFNPTMIQHMCHSDLYNVACRLDRVGYFDEGQTPCLIEMKCGAEAPWHRIQTAIQQVCLGSTYIRRYALYLKADGTYRLREHKDATEPKLVPALAGIYWYNRNQKIKRKGE